LLLDRRKIRKWAKWIALGLAIVFALSFLFMGVGYGGGAGFNISEIFSGGGCSGNTASEETQTELDKLLVSLEADPDNADLMVQVGDQYALRYDPESGAGADNLDKAAEYYEMALRADADLKEVYQKLTAVYIDSYKYDDAARVLNKATSVDPDNPDVYFQLGYVQRNLGRTGQAILAWQKYLQLVPTGKTADGIRAALEEMTTTTTAGTSD
jgi:tetratricopeptide (TPR) repeat protein